MTALKALLVEVAFGAPPVVRTANSALTRVISGDDGQRKWYELQGFVVHRGLGRFRIDFEVRKSNV